MSLSSPSRIRPQDLAIAAALLVLVLCVFLQAVFFQFINWDDPTYVTENSAVRQGLGLANLIWAFNGFHAANWHPLTWLSHMLDASLFGMDPRGHHATSIALHAANAILLYAFLARATGDRWRAALVAALFAVHPLHVESVAWVSERKDVLSTFFWLATMHLYLDYAREPGRLRLLGVSMGLGLGLLAKPMLVTLPFVLLLLDLWPLKRWPPQSDAPGQRRAALQRLVVEKLPLFALVLLFSGITLLAQRQATARTELVTVLDRFANALISYAAYLGKTLYPANLSFFYPFRDNWAGATLAVALVVLTALSAWAWQERNRRPALLVGWLWYLGTLVPVIGLVQVGAQGMADRYTYIPLIGVFICVAWAIPDLASPHRWRNAVLSCTLVALAALAAVAHVYAGKWRSSFDLYAHAVSAAPDNFRAHTLLADQYAKQGKLDLARSHAFESLRLGETIKLARTVENINYNFQALGNIEFAAGDMAKAADYYGRAAALVPNDPLSRFNLGRALKNAGQHAQAIGAFEEAVRLDPEYAGAHNHLGFSLLVTGNSERAIEHYQRAIRLRPDYAEAHFNLAVALELQNRHDEAINAYRKALDINPDNVINHLRLAQLLIARGRGVEAVRNLSEVLRLNPGNAAALEMQRGLISK